MARTKTWILSSLIRFHGEGLLSHHTEWKNDTQEAEGVISPPESNNISPLRTFTSKEKRF